MADFVFSNKTGSSDFSSTGDKVNDVFGDLLLNRTELEAMITSLKRRQYGATPPANPNTGDIWECSTTGGGYTATVAYRYNGSAWLELVAAAINVANRNTVLQGKVDASGNPALFEAGTGLAVKLNATATPAIFAFMNGNSASLGTVDIVAAVSADAATFWSSLPTTSTVYLCVDYTTGTVSGGFTTVAPVYQSIAPTHSAGLHWLDFNTGKVWSSDGSAWTQRNRIFVGTATTDGSGVTAVSIYPYNDYVAAAINVANRNTVLQGKVDASGNPALFEAGTGLTCKLNATATPAIFAFMNGNSSSTGAQDIIDGIAADSATFWSSLPVNSTVYLCVDRNSGGVLSGNYSTVAPVAQAHAPAHSAGLHWLDFNIGMVQSSDGSAWTQRHRVFVGTATTDGTGVTAVSICPYNQYRGDIVGNVTGGASLDVPLSYLDTDTTLAANSDSKIATQKAVKTYVDANIGTVASSAEAIAGADNTKMLTPLQLRNGLNASGNAPVYACRAWVNFNGTATPAIRGSGNVSSITDNGTGDYTINFATAMPDINYGVSGSAQRNNTSGAIQNVSVFKGTSYAPTVSKVHVIVANGSDVAEDPLMASVVIFR